MQLIIIYLVWKEALHIWKISLTANLYTSLPFLFSLVLLNLFVWIPLVGQLSALIESYLIFSYIVFTSKLYIDSEGNPEALKSGLRSVSLTKVLSSYPGEVIGVLVAQIFLTVLALLLSLVILSAGGALSVIKPLLEGGDVSWKGLLFSLLIAVFLYFSVVSSFPIFFGRAMLRGRGFSGTLLAFISSLWAEVSWRTMLSWDYIKSSVVVSLITFGFLLLHLILLIPPLLLLGPILTFLTVHFLYTFGTVACFRLLRS